MKRILLTALFVLIGSLAFAQELIIVVAPFDVRAEFPKADAETIEYLFVNELSKYKSIKILDQSDAMFKETEKRMDFELTDWSNPNKVADFGRAINANAVVLGRIMTLDKEVIIAVRINDLNTEIKAANDMFVTNVSEIRGKLPAFTAEIVDRLPKSKKILEAEKKKREAEEREALAEERKNKIGDLFVGFKENANRNHWDYMSGIFLWGDDGLVGGGGSALLGIHWSPIPFLSIGAETIFCGFDGNKVNEKFYATGSFTAGFVFPLKYEETPKVLFFCDGVLDIGKFSSYSGLIQKVLTPCFDAGLSFRWSGVGLDIKYKRIFLDGYAINGINAVVLWGFW